MSSGHLVEVTTRLICGDTRREFYGVCTEDRELASELVVAERVIMFDQSVHVLAALAAPDLATLSMNHNEVRYFGMSETTSAPATDRTLDLMAV